MREEKHELHKESKKMDSDDMMKKSGKMMKKKMPVGTQKRMTVMRKGKK
jgi:hypothetical protein